MALALDFGPHNDKDHIHFIRLREVNKTNISVRNLTYILLGNIRPLHIEENKRWGYFVDKNRSDDKKSLVLKLVDNWVVINFNNLMSV